MMYVAVTILGLCLGSFANAVVWRIHEQSRAEGKGQRAKKGKPSPSDLSILKGRSMCTKCHHQLVWTDLLPVVSWLMLRGKCKYCSKSISAQYPIVELLTAAVFVTSYAFWPAALTGLEWVNFSLWLALCTGLMALIIYDLRWMLLPNRIVYSLFFIVVTQRVIDVGLNGGGVDSLMASVYGLLVGGGLFYVLFQVSGGKWIGGGDVKLGYALGVSVGGPWNSLLLLFVASLLGTAVTLPLLVTKKAKASTRIPFGPFLIIAAVIVKLFGASILTWYKRKFLLL